MLCKVFLIRRNVIVDICQNEPCFMPPVFFYLNLTLLLIMKMNKNIFFISLVKKKELRVIPLFNSYLCIWSNVIFAFAEITQG